jgi:hypothetical protein
MQAREARLRQLGEILVECPAMPSGGLLLQTDLEVPGPDLSRPAVHLDPDVAVSCSRLECLGIVPDDLVPAVRPK